MLNKVGTYERTPEIREKMRRSRLAHAELHARGLRLTPSGYLEYTRGQYKGRGVHRVVMEILLGRRLERWEHVHHKDHNRQNNDPSNLELLTWHEHARHHAREYASLRTRNDKGQFSEGKVRRAE